MNKRDVEKKLLEKVNANTRKNKNTLGRTLTTVAVAGSGTAAVAMLGVANYLVSKVTVTTPTLDARYKFTPYEFDVEHQDIEFPTANDRILKGWLFPRPQTDRVIIAVSGHGGCKEEVLGIGSFLWKAGFNVLLFDYRGCGCNKDKGDMQTLGHRELEDFQAAIAYAKKRFADEGRKAKIGLFGGSLGGAVSLVAAARDPEIQAIWADSSFTDRREVITHGWQTITKLPGTPFIEMADWFFRQRTGQPIAEFSPLAEIKKMQPRPIFIVHGGGDVITPVEHAYRLYDAAPGPKELWVEPDLYHCGVYFNHRAEYTRRAIEFFDKYLK